MKSFCIYHGKKQRAKLIFANNWIIASANNSDLNVDNHIVERGKWNNNGALVYTIVARQGKLNSNRTQTSQRPRNKHLSEIEAHQHHPKINHEWRWRPKCGSGSANGCWRRRSLQGWSGPIRRRGKSRHLKCFSRVHHTLKSLTAVKQLFICWSIARFTQFCGCNSC